MKEETTSHDLCWQKPCVYILRPARVPLFDITGRLPCEYFTKKSEGPTFQPKDPALTIANFFLLLVISAI